MSHRRTALVSVAALGLVTLIGSALTGVASPANAAAPTCEGRAATLTDADVRPDEEGTPMLNGTAGDDVIVIAEDGVDYVYGHGGDDLICHTSPEDLTISGGPGSDTIHGGPGVTRYYLVASKDAQEATPGDVDHIHDAGGPDELILWVDAGEALIDVPTHHVTGVNLDATWHDRLEGYVSKGNSGTVFTGGPAIDRYISEGTDSVIRSSGGADRITARQPADIETGDGHDEVNLRASAGAPRASRIATEGGDDYVAIDGAGPQHVSMGEGNDVVHVRKDAGADARVDLGAGHDALHFAGRTTAVGGSGNDTFYPEADGDDGLQGELDGGSGTNRINFTGVRSGVRSYLDQGFSHWGDSILGTRRISRTTGSRYADVLAGTTYSNHISGGGDNDRLVGRAGNDILTGDSGRDRAEGGPGNDRCSAESKVSC
jgi:Ca2+-binding RTX toxin-like protein